jgi:hypothetical protein
MSVGAARAHFVNQTRVSFSSGHGTQVSYMAPNGMIYLWYPGNQIVLPGRWSIEPRPRGYADLCFQYGPNTYNPVAGQVGGQKNCRPADYWAQYEVDGAAGDVFGLSRQHSVPFILRPERTSIAQRGRLGR